MYNLNNKCFACFGREGGICKRTKSIFKSTKCPDRETLFTENNQNNKKRRT